nr:DUF2975 domain-containing protein [Pseudoxanthomonas sp.]
MNKTENTSALLRHARWLRRGVLASAVACLLVTALALLWPTPFPGVAATLDEGGLPWEWAALTAALLAVLTSWALLELARMLGRLQSSALFSSAVTRHFRRFASRLLAVGLLNALLPPLLQAALAWHAARPGPLRLDFGGGDLLVLLMGATFFLVARLFDEAARLEEDSHSIV